MTDLAAGFAIFLIIEGLIWALVSRDVFRLMIAALDQSERTLEAGGWLAFLAGVALLWAVRG